MEQINNKVYGRPQNRLIERFFSDIFEPPQDGDVLIEQGNEDYHAHVHLKYQAMDENGCHNYKVIDGKVAETTTDEKEAELAACVLVPAVRIADLKRQLTDTDYQIIKCSECQLVGKSMPYDVAALHAERQALRDRINELEATLGDYGVLTEFEKGRSKV